MALFPNSVHIVIICRGGQMDSICVLIFSFHVHFYFLMVTVTGDHRYLYKARTQFYTSYGGIAVCVCLCVFVVTMHRRFNSVPINHGEPLSQPYIYRVN